MLDTIRYALCATVNLFAIAPGITTDADDGLIISRRATLMLNFYQTDLMRGCKLDINLSAVLILLLI